MPIPRSVPCCTPTRPQPLARTYKLGVWFNSENFADQQFDNTGLSLANPASNGVPLAHHGNFGVYATADQLVWVDPTESDRTSTSSAESWGRRRPIAT